METTSLLHNCDDEKSTSTRNIKNLKRRGAREVTLQYSEILSLRISSCESHNWILFLDTRIDVKSRLCLGCSMSRTRWSLIGQHDLGTCADGHIQRNTTSTFKFLQLRFMSMARSVRSSTFTCTIILVPSPPPRCMAKDFSWNHCCSSSSYSPPCHHPNLESHPSSHACVSRLS